MYGAESVILNLARTLNQSGNQCLLAVFANSTHENHELHEIAVKRGITTFVIPCAGRVDRKAISRIRALTLEIGAEIVHCHGYKADIYAYLALRKHGIPLVSTCHNWLDTDPSVYVFGVLDRIVLRRFAVVIAVSDAVRQRLRSSGVRPNRIEFIRNGIDTAPFASTPRTSAPGNRRPLVVGLVGRLAWEKGIDVFIEAAGRALSDMPQARFTVVGEGPDRAKLQALIDTLGVASSVSLMGRREDMPVVYGSFDIMVSSSRQEGLPIAILEGMASGLPLIATTVGEVPSVVRDGETGILLPPSDTQALSSAMVDLLRDSEKCRRLGSAARQLVESEYSAARMGNEYLSLYRNAIGGADDRRKAQRVS
jgi:glycosyltransferase involved in cell wall biosynthesis